MAIVSRNPATEEVLKEFMELKDDEINVKLNLSEKAFSNWKNSTFESRDEKLSKLADLLLERKDSLAQIAALEIGQPIKAVKSEIEKCASLANYYKGKIGEYLKDEIIPTDAQSSFVCYEPLGTILGIAPWNFPFWMAFRFIIPTISAGNTVILKHASNVPQSALAIQKLMDDAGFPEGVFQILLVSSLKIEDIIRDERVKAVSFSGSEAAGSQVASIAGQEVKKALLELGGSDAFIVFEDADLENTAKTLVENRLRNAGQACNSPKRVFVQSTIETDFIELLKGKLLQIKQGDPLDINTEIGPQANLNGLDELERQVKTSIEMGAKLLIGGERVSGQGYFYKPTIITNIKAGMPLFDEEVFGPILAIASFTTEDEAIELANNTQYGLGASIWTNDIEKAKKYIHKIETANVFINQPVRSDPRLPYGGIKHSGFGRELSYFGIREFTNIKTIVIK